MVKTATIFIVSLLLVLSGFSGAANSETILLTEKSLYRNIVVSENKDTRCLRFSRQSSTQQSCFSLKNPQTLLFECNKMMLGSLYLNPAPRKVLMIGLGGGTLVSAVARILPQAEIDIVEIDPAIVRVAKEYFNFQPTAKMRVNVMDGRVFVKRAIEKGEKYDLIMLDAFGDVYIPPHLMTIQFHNEVKQLLTHDGVVAANTYVVGGRYANESVTYESVYGSFFNLKKYWYNTRVIIAKPDGLPGHDLLVKNSKILDKKFLQAGIEASWLLSLFSTEKDWDESARVLTDLFVPF
jgi:spermidine synthase